MKLMKWFVEYTDGTFYREDQIEFFDIKKDQIKYFGLDGMGTIFKHTISNGQFELNQNKICFLLDGKLIGKSTDVINFKQKIEAVYGASGGGIVGYYTGWKESNEDFSYIEVLFWVDMTEQKIKLRMRLTPLKDSCKFNMIINGVLNERELNLEVGKKQEFVFEI